MIDYINGQLIKKMPTLAVVENNGVGFSLQISTTTYNHLPEAGEQVRLLTYLHVREDILQLFAFARETERTVFTSLIAVAGVGPRLAQTILSGIPVSELTESIQSGDVGRLTSISGVGKKTAQRLVIELREKFTQAGLIDETPAGDGVPDVWQPREEEALLALISLGYRKKTVEDALRKVKRNGPVETVEELIKLTLQNI